MIEYTETEVLNAIKTMGLFRTSYPKNVVEKVVKNALQVADRLEQVDSDVYNKFCNKFHNDCYSQYKCYEDGHKCEEAGSYVYGYRQALADIRGDKE